MQITFANEVTLAGPLALWPFPTVAAVRNFCRKVVDAETFVQKYTGDTICIPYSADVSCVVFATTRQCCHPLTVLRYFCIRTRG